MRKLNKIIIWVIFLAIFFVGKSMAQKKDIPISELPIDVKLLVEDYFRILKTGTLDDAEVRFSQLAGGDLIDEDGTTLREDVKPVALRRDRLNLKFYSLPVNITKVTVYPDRTSGLGIGAIKGDLYKVYVARKEGKSSYISIIVPENHPTITSPKIVEIGNL